MKINLKRFVLIIFFLLFLIFAFFFLGKAKPAKEINWGVVFSQKHSQLMGLDWRENYLAILDDLKVKNLKLVAYWDLIEKEKGVYNFEDLDWQIEEAEKRDSNILLVFGRRVPRWPECHFPEWAENMEEKERKEELLKLIEKIVLRYKDNESIKMWQVENEPFFPFGLCPPPDEELLKKEIELVKSLDNRGRPIVLTESGELPLWFKAAKLGDVVGHTLYRKVWFEQFNSYFSYPFPPVFYHRKAWLIDKIFSKKVICVELQAEPWGNNKLLYDLPLDEQEKTMNLKRFKDVIEFAENTGEDTFYLWGSEWWYWMKEKKEREEIWNESKKLF
jgi:hypothetical protein